MDTGLAAAALASADAAVERVVKVVREAKVWSAQVDVEFVDSQIR